MDFVWTAAGTSSVRPAVNGYLNHQCVNVSATVLRQLKLAVLYDCPSRDMLKRLEGGGGKFDKNASHHRIFAYSAAVYDKLIWLFAWIVALTLRQAKSSALRSNIAWTWKKIAKRRVNFHIHFYGLTFHLSAFQRKSSVSEEATPWNAREWRRSEELGTWTKGETHSWTKIWIVCLA